ncbi:hypothetical protein DSECCO2_459750 [anaerobic digester metagenome]
MFLVLCDDLILAQHSYHNLQADFSYTNQRLPKDIPSHAQDVFGMTLTCVAGVRQEAMSYVIVKAIPTFSGCITKTNGRGGKIVDSFGAS